MMKQIRYVSRGIVPAALVLLIILGFGSCMNPLDITGSKYSDDVATLQISINTGNARTLIPSVSFAKYELTFTDVAGVETHSLEPLEGANAKTITLAPATWKIVVTAFILEGSTYVESAFGEAQVTLNAGETKPVPIKLQPKESGANGSFSYAVTFPSENISNAFLRLSKGGSVIANKNLLSDALTDTISLTPGYYSLLLRIENNDGIIFRSEIVHIYPGLVTTAPSYTFSPSDFNFTDGDELKPAELPAIASFDEVIAKLDEIIAYAGTSAAEKASAEDLKNQLNSNESTFRLVWSSMGGSYVTTINALIDTISDDDDEGGSGGSGSGDGSIPTALSTSASFDEVIAKLDEIIAYAGASAAEKASAEELKNQLTSNESTFRLVWSSMGGSYVTTINALIDTISDDDDEGGSGGSGSGDGSIPTALSTSASFDETIAKLDAIIAYAGISPTEKASAEDLKNQLTSNEPTLRPMWSVAGGSYITLINVLINTISSGGASLSGSITISPAGSAAVGAQLTATYAGGSEAVSYQWYKNGTSLSASGTTYIPGEAGSYTVTVSAEGYVSKTSDPVTVTGASLPSLSGNINISPSVDVTAFTELIAGYTGSTETVTYQWNKDGSAITGASSYKYKPTSAGNYSVTVSALGYQSKTSDPVAVAGPLFNITISPSSSVAPGTLLTANYSGVGNLTDLLWNKGGIPISGASSYTYLPFEPGSYSVTAYVSFASLGGASQSSKTSDSVTVSGGAPTVTISPNSGVTTRTLLTATYSGSSETIFNWQWYKDGVEIDYYTGTDQTFFPTEAGSYTVKVNLMGEQRITSAAVTVSASPIDLAISGKTWNPDANYSNVVVSGLTIADTSALSALYERVYDEIGGDISLDLSACTLPAELAYDSELDYYAKQSFVSIILPASVTSTADGNYFSSAFSDFDNLKSITAPGLITVGAYTFDYLPSLTSVNLPAATIFGMYAFGNCNSLTTVDLPAATTFGYGVFAYCTSLTSVSFPVVTAIGSEAFYGCTNLILIDLPATLTTISGDSFIGCSSLSTINVAAGNTAFSAENGMLMNKNKTTLIAYPTAAGAVEIPTITSVGDFAFYFCTSLVSVSLPAATTFGEQAFGNCSSLTMMNLPAATTFGYVTFYNIGNTALTIILGTAIPTIERPFSDSTNKSVTFEVPSSAFSAYQAEWSGKYWGGTGISVTITGI